MGEINYCYRNRIMAVILMIWFSFISMRECNLGYYEDQGACYRCKDGWKRWDKSNSQICTGEFSLNIYLTKACLTSLYTFISTRDRILAF